MTYGLISDIHANLTALEAVLDRLTGVGRFICPGDVVSYGPDPMECLSRVRSLDCVTVLGNHDAAVCGMMDASWFNRDAREAVAWTRGVLPEPDVRSLSILPLTHAGDGFVLVHGSLATPADFPYILSPGEARRCFEEMGEPTSPQSSSETGRGSVCFIGHSHVCEVYIQQPGVFGVDQIEMPDGGRLDLRPGMRYIVNCGSVGQPRDGNPDASCAIFDSDAMTVEIVRVPYEIPAVQGRMRRAGLPQMLIDRLEYGV